MTFPNLAAVMPQGIPNVSPREVPVADRARGIIEQLDMRSRSVQTQPPASIPASSRPGLISQLFSHYDPRSIRLAASPIFTVPPGREDQSPRHYSRNELKGFARTAAKKYGLNEQRFLRQMFRESAWNPDAQSSVGAASVAQLMPKTAHNLGVKDRWDPEQSIDGGARLMRENLDRYEDYDLALAAYNAGPDAVEKYGGIPPYSETEDYVDYIMGREKRKR